MLDDLASIQLDNGIAFHVASHNPSALVTVEGSFRTAPDVAKGDLLLQRLTTLMIDKEMSMGAGRETDRIGMEWRFESDHCRVRFHGRIMADRLESAVETLAEQLRCPTFDEEEFARQKSILSDMLRMEAGDPSEGARALLLRILYPPAHPRHMPELDECLATLNRLEVGQVRDYHRRHFGSDGMIIVVVANVAPERLARAFNAHLGTWPAHGCMPHLEQAANTRTTNYTESTIDGHGLCSIAMGHGLPLRQEDADYLPLYAAIYMLGGNFSSRLQATVRNRDGLVYRIGAQLAPPLGRCGGHWQVTLVRNNDGRKEALEATYREIQHFISHGPTETEYAEKLESIPGASLVRLANAGGMACALIECFEQGLDAEYLRTLGKRLNSLGIKDIKSAVHRHLHSDQICVVVAGPVC